MKLFWFFNLIVSIPFGIVLAALYAFIASFVRFFLLEHQLPDGIPLSQLTGFDWLIMGGIIVGSMLFFFGINLKKKIIDGETNFNPFRHEHVTAMSPDKKRAQAKPVPAEYLSPKPNGLTVGRYHGQYVRIPFLSSPEHQLILGAPGSKKSVTLKNALISIFNFAHECRAVLAIDIKPELSKDTCVETDPSKVAIISPASIDENRSGFDVYYGLSQSCTDDDLYDRFSLIAGAIIANPGGSNSYFYEQSVNILTAFLMFGFRKGMSFVDSLCHVDDASTEDYIAEIIADPEMESHPRIKRLVREFDGKTSDSAQDVGMTLKKNLACFSYESVRYCFDGNPNKVTPIDLANGKSIFLAIPSHLVGRYSVCFRVIVESCLSYLMSRPEDHPDYLLDNRPFWFLIDEAASCRVPSLLGEAGALAVGRSKKIMVSLVFQSEGQIRDSYGQDGATTITDCCKTTIVLSCNNVSTAKSLSERTGMYRETKLSTSSKPSSFSGVSSYNESTEYRPVMDVSDITALERDERALVFARGDWFLVKKAPYFSIPAYDRKSKEILKENSVFYPNPEKDDDQGAFNDAGE